MYIKVKRSVNDYVNKLTQTISIYIKASKSHYNFIVSI